LVEVLRDRYEIPKGLAINRQNLFLGKVVHGIIISEDYRMSNPLDPPPKPI